MWQFGKLVAWRVWQARTHSLLNANCFNILRALSYLGRLSGYVGMRCGLFMTASRIISVKIVAIWALYDAEGFIRYDV